MTRFESSSSASISPSMLGFTGTGITSKLIAKLKNRLRCVRLHTRAECSSSDPEGIEKGLADDVIHIRSIKEPIMASEINLLVSGAQFFGENRLGPRQEPLRDHGIEF